MDVGSHRQQMFFIADVPIPILAHPELFFVWDIQSKFLIPGENPSRSKRFPSLNNFCKLITAICQDMDMIRHDAPSDELIADTMKMQ